MTRCAYVALIGRPNVGKSTLLNRLIGQKISITAPKPQTTRHNIVGITTHDDVQLLYVDTPGIHHRTPRALNRYLNRTATGALGNVDLAVQLIEARHWTEEDVAVAALLQPLAVEQRILVVNKVDQVADKRQLLPFIASLSQHGPFAEIVPLSARSGANLEALQRALEVRAPERPFLYPEDQVTTVSQRFLAAELIREKLTRILRQELPYSLTVEVERFEQEGGLLRIGAVIWVERSGQKAIVIGEQGKLLREIGRQARLDMEKIFEQRVYLETWVKVREDWVDDERALRSFGYHD